MDGVVLGTPPTALSSGDIRASNCGTQIKKKRSTLAVDLLLAITIFGGGYSPLFVSVSGNWYLSTAELSLRKRMTPMMEEMMDMDSEIIPPLSIEMML